MRLIDEDALMKELGITSDDCCECEWGDGNGYCTRTSDFTEACDAICTALPIEPEPQWIPCSERLPEEETDVLVTRTFLGVKDGSNGWNNHIPPNTYVEVANRIGDEWYSDSDEYKIARSRHTDPIAWMPLPEPYKEG